MTRPCQTEGCANLVKRGGDRGPWPKHCRSCRLKREAANRRQQQAPGTTTAKCRDCPAIFDVPSTGNHPERCETCTRIRKRKQSAVRQARWRERHGNIL